MIPHSCGLTQRERVRSVAAAAAAPETGALARYGIGGRAGRDFTILQSGIRGSNNRATRSEAEPFVLE